MHAAVYRVDTAERFAGYDRLLHDDCEQERDRAKTSWQHFVHMMARRAVLEQSACMRKAGLLVVSSNMVQSVFVAVHDTVL